MLNFTIIWPISLGIIIVRQVKKNMKYSFPKIDLHLHLDGSNRIDTIWELAQAQGVKLPGETKQDYDNYLAKCQTSGAVNEFLKQFDAPLLVQQDRESLIRVTKELIEDLHNQGLAYAEIRFAPQLHTQKQMSQAISICMTKDA